MTTAHPHHGFSLLELLMALACISVLAAWAWPNYQVWVLQAQRAQARGALLQAAHWLERAASANGSYPLPAEIPSSVLQTQGQGYRLTVVSTSQSYTLSAIPLGSQAADACGTLTLNHLGVRSVQGANQTAALCWSR
jgi:type IV pilus assembly protein PilE